MRWQICYSSVSPLQEAVAIGFEQADKEGFWESSKHEMKGKVDRLNEVWDELGLPVFISTPVLGPHVNNWCFSSPIPRVAISSWST